MREADRVNNMKNHPGTVEPFRGGFLSKPGMAQQPSVGRAPCGPPPDTRRTIAAEHKGALRAESDAESTRFILTLPLLRK